MSPEENYSRERFLFASEAMQDEHALHVVRFSGHEGLNELYEFEITIVTTEKSLPLEDMLSKKAKFTILGNDTPDAKFSGFVTKIVQTSRYNDWTFYHLTLQPGFWYYTQTVQNNFFIDKTVKELLDGCLDKLDNCDLSHEFKLEASYRAQPFSMQHNETLHDYMSWKMERDGIYYYFEEKDDGEHLVFTDSKNSHTPLDNVKSLRYSPTSGMENAHRDEVITSFAMNCSPLPQWVVLRDYNWRNPNTPVIAKELVSEKGLGEVYYYGEGYDTVDEGKRLAAIRAEALRCRARTWNGTSAVPCLRPGRNFTLENHYDDAFNREYTITSVTHEGSQEAHLSQAIGVPIDNPDRLYYRNSFACIASDQQFRPERRTKRAKVSGMITAFVDSSSDSAVAEVNDEGCYKVYFPQDDNGHGAGKASCWIRRMQPHLGQGHGFALPLAPGIEVLVAFMDGDPDRPVIAGAVSNAESGYVENPSTSQITGLNTSGGNALLFNEKGTKQGMMLKTGARSGIMMSAGSTDAVVEYSDNAFEFYNCLGSQEAGILNEVQAGFEQTLQADHGVFDIFAAKSLAWEAMEMLANACEWTSNFVALDEDATDDEKKSETGTKTTNWADGFSYTASLMKAFKEVLSLALKDADEGEKYSSALSASDKSAGLSLKTTLDGASYMKYIVFLAIKNCGKLATDLAAVGLTHTDKDASPESKSLKKTVEKTQYDKRAAARDFAWEDLTTLVAEITALITSWKARKKLMQGDQPKGMLFNSVNGPLVAKTNENIVMLAREGMLFSAVPRPGSMSHIDYSSSVSPTNIKNEFNVENNTIKLQASNIENYALNNLTNISCTSLTSSAPTISLSTKKNRAFKVKEIKDLYEKIGLGETITNIPVQTAYDRYNSLKADEYSEIELKRKNNASNINIKNIKGSVKIDNVLNGTTGEISILNKKYIIDKNNDSVSGIIMSGSSLEYGFIKDKFTTKVELADNNATKTEKYGKIDFQIDGAFNSKSKEMSFESTSSIQQKAQTITLTGTQKINLELGNTTFTLTPTLAGTEAFLIKLN